jgi:hypothetical protein
MTIYSISDVRVMIIQFVVSPVNLIKPRVHMFNYLRTEGISFFTLINVFQHFIVNIFLGCEQVSFGHFYRTDHHCQTIITAGYAGQLVVIVLQGRKPSQDPNNDWGSYSPGSEDPFNCSLYL